MSTYKQLTLEQRYQSYALKKAGHVQTDIADFVRVHKSTISRELRRNWGQRGYRPKQAHHFALARRKQARPRIQPRTWRLVAEKLQADRSPEQISGWLCRNGHELISHPDTVLKVKGRRVLRVPSHHSVECARHSAIPSTRHDPVHS